MSASVEVKNNTVSFWSQFRNCMFGKRETSVGAEQYQPPPQSSATKPNPTLATVLNLSVGNRSTIQSTPGDHHIKHPVPIISIPASPANSLRKQIKRSNLFDFEIIRVLAQSDGCVLKLAIHKPTGTQVVLKVQCKKLKNTHSIQREAQIMGCLRHPNICLLYNSIDLREEHTMVLEYMSGGDLFDAVEPDVGCPLEEARSYFAQMCNAVYYMHEKNIVHRDLKPENVTLDGKGGVKVIDFGLSICVTSDMRHGVVGTVPYMAPEVIKYYGVKDKEVVEQVDLKAVDVWALGVVLFTLVTGRFPWTQAVKCMSAEYTRYCAGDFSFHPWQTLHPTFITLLQMMLRCDPTQRATVEQIMTFVHEKWQPEVSKPQDALDMAVAKMLTPPISTSSSFASSGSTSPSRQRVTGRHRDSIDLQQPTKPIAVDSKKATTFAAQQRCPVNESTIVV